MKQSLLSRAIIAGCAYFAIVFAAGFVLGTFRVLVLLPRLGEGLALMLELPVMLGISWFVCRWIITRVGVSNEIAERLLMGVVAFALLMIAEFGISVFALGRTFAAHLAHYQTGPGLSGLAGQVLFALFPVIMRTRSS